MKVRQRISDFQRLVNTKVADIRREAESAWTPINLKQTEPLIVYSFLSSTVGGVGYLNRSLAPILSVEARTVKFAGIFLHQKPMVIGLRRSAKAEIPIGGRCELGDLQLLFLYVSKDKSVWQCRSTIFQAKLTPSAKGPVINHPDQRRLYDSCQGFRYETVLVGEERNLPWGIAERERALQYLFIGELPVRAHLIPSANNKGAFIDFGELIFRFLNDSTGFRVTVKPPKGRNWSRIVWDQIEHIARTQFAHHGPRQAALKALLDRFNSFDDPKEFFCGERPDGPSPEKAVNRPSGGIPLLMIIVSDNGLEDPSNEFVDVTTQPDDPCVTQHGAHGHLKHEKLGLKSRFKDETTSDLLALANSTTERTELQSILSELLTRANAWQVSGEEVASIRQTIERGTFRANPQLDSFVAELESQLQMISSHLQRESGIENYLQ